MELLVKAEPLVPGGRAVYVSAGAGKVCFTLCDLDSTLCDGNCVFHENMEDLITVGYTEQRLSFSESQILAQRVKAIIMRWCFYVIFNKSIKLKRGKN